MSKFIPNSFQIPNAFVDERLKSLSGNAVKCYLLIARKTTGWQKSADRISTVQFMEFCGIKDRKTAFAVIDELEKICLINVVRTKGEINEFSLNFFIDKNDDYELVPKNGTSTKNLSELVPKNGTSTSTKNWDTTKDNIKNNITNIPPKSPTGGLVDSFDVDICSEIESEEPILDKKSHGKKSSIKIDYQAVMDAYNQANTETGGRLPYAQSLTEKRKRAMKKLLTEHLSKPTLECAVNYFERLFELLRPFHVGEGERGWRANFDWAIRGETVVKVREEAL